MDGGGKDDQVEEFRAVGGVQSRLQPGQGGQGFPARRALPPDVNAEGDHEEGSENQGEFQFELHE